jgi:Tetratricopeptide repeat
VARLTDDLFDAIEFDAARRGDHKTAALRMSRLAGTGDPAGGMSRAEAYLRAGEQWLLAGEPAEAADAFRLAIADGGPTFVDPRVPLARAFFLLGEPEQAITIVSQLKSESPRDPRVCDLVAELLLEQDDMLGALTWVTTGVELCLADSAAEGPPAPRSDAGAELRLLLNLRYRIRNDLGLPEDDYDRLIDDLAG